MNRGDKVKGFMIGLLIGLFIIDIGLSYEAGRQKKEIQTLKKKTNDMQEKIRQVKWEIEETYYICGLNER